VIKKLMLGVAMLALVLVGVGWLYRAEILTQLALRQAEANKRDVGPEQAITWQRGPAEPARALADRPPNIVFILLDDLGYNDITTFGGGLADGAVPTPNIDRLAREGAVFRQAYSGTGTCAPSRAMLMTGRYPTHTGFEYTPTPDGMNRVIPPIINARERGHFPQVETNPEKTGEAFPFEDQGLPTSEITVAEVLKGKGYHNVHIGKWHLGRREDFLPNAQGFDESLMMDSGLFLAEDDPNVVNAKHSIDPIDQFLWAAMQYSATFNGSAPFKPGGYLTDWWTDESLRVIEANRNRPFFLYLAHWAPHTPLQATREDFEAVGDIRPHRKRVYAAMIRAVDRSVGRVLDKLEAEGLADNTIVVLSSDNGGAGYIDLPKINAPFRGWKITLFEGGIRVPMFVKWPARVAPGTAIDTPVAHIDLMPTLAEAAGVALPDDRIINGRSLLGAATGAGVVEREDDALFWKSGAYNVVRSGDWKLHLDARQDKTWLFDLAKDPAERTNLADNRPEKVAELSALIEAHLARRTTGPLYPHGLVSPIPLDKTQGADPEPGDEYVMWFN